MHASLLVIHDNGSKFKLHFVTLCDQLGTESRSTAVKNPQTTAILKCQNGVLGNVLHTVRLCYFGLFSKGYYIIWIRHAILLVIPGRLECNRAQELMVSQ